MYAIGFEGCLETVGLPQHTPRYRHPRSELIHFLSRQACTTHYSTRVSHLCGPLDAHLRTIEAGLQVSIAHRHEQFKVDGPKAVAMRAMEILQAIYERADRPISPDMVQRLSLLHLSPSPQPYTSYRRRPSVRCTQNSRCH